MSIMASRRSSLAPLANSTLWILLVALAMTVFTDEFRLPEGDADPNGDKMDAVIAVYGGKESRINSGDQHFGHGPVRYTKRRPTVFRVGPPSAIWSKVSADHAAHHHKDHMLGGGSSAECFSRAVYEQLQACIDKLEQPGDECRIADGVYPLGALPPLVIAGKHGSEQKPIVVAGESGANVQLLGTFPVKLSSPWTKDETSGVWSAKVEEPLGGITQLFDDDNLMYTPARWPDAFWYDRTMYLGPERWAHFNSSVHNVTTHYGMITDGGTCSQQPKPTDQKVHCDRMPGLAESGINATGAVMVLDAWSCDTGAQIVTHHTPGSNTIFYNATHYNHCDALRTRGIYYLVGKREFVTGPTEWMYEKETSTLYLIPETGKDVHSLQLHAKQSSWAINLTDSSFVTLANMSFFGTALLAADGNLVAHPPQEPAPYPETKPHGLISRIRLEGLRFDFPSASKRMLGSIVVPDTVTIFAPTSGKTTNITRNITVYNCTFFSSDGAPLLVNTDNFTIEQSMFHYCDWSCVSAGPKEPGRDGAARTLPIKGDDARVIRNTFSYNGKSAALSGTTRLFAQLNHFYGQAELEGDGTYIEGRGAPGAKDIIVQNWARDTGKLGFRLDGDSTTPVPVGDGGLVSHNVAINTSGIHAAGNGHIVEYNTAIDGTYITAGDATVSYMFQTPGATLNVTYPAITIVLLSKNSAKGEGVTTLFRNNAADNFDPGQSKSKNNVVGGFDGAIDLRDAWNFDFRPCPQSIIAKKGVGAYNASVGKVYWIPGRQEWQPSTPIPRHGTNIARLDTDLMFLGALNADRHSVYFGRNEGSLEKVCDLVGEENVADISQQKLAAKQLYFWRVDAMVDSQTVTGKVWHFITGDKKSCIS